MPKKSRKGRLKHQRRVNPQPIAIKEAGSSTQVSSLSTKQTTAAKTPVATAEQNDRYQYARSDLKRTFITGGAIFALLIILYFLLH